MKIKKSNKSVVAKPAIKVGGFAIYNHSYYGEIRTIITNRKNNHLWYWAFIGQESWGSDQRKEFRAMTKKEIQTSKDYLIKLQRNSKTIERAISLA